MIEILPQDVNEIIYTFLIFSKNQNKLYCISKKTSKNISNSHVFKEYNLFKERINMAKEDLNNSNINIRTNNNLFDKWNRFHLHEWSNYASIKRMWKIGDYVDAYDYVKGWCPAKIINQNIEKKTNIIGEHLAFEYVRKYTIKFLGWSDSFIENVEIDKLRHLGKYTINPFDMYGSISRDCSGNSYWVLCKKEHEKYWKMQRIIERIIEDDCIKLLTYIGTIFVVKKKNIHKVIRHITDATAFFSIDSEYCFFKKRTFDI
tara:strand:- start:8430 stop:9209 length:780 start_codon:yes stop_codon:yes gene_type:complete